MRHLRRVVDHVGLFQIDSVNVVVRAHYMPLFSRLGPYPTGLLDDAAYQRRLLFEYWGHEASLLPVERYPLFRFRMDSMRPWASIRRLHAEHPGYIESVLAEIHERGPSTVGDLADPGRRTGPWWGWGRGKDALEWLFATGRLAVRSRRAFARVYDLPERVLPKQILTQSPLPAEEAQRRLVALAAHHHGVATAAELADYYRLPPALARQRVQELVADGELTEVRVQGWKQPAYVRAGRAIPRRVQARALLSPFDPLIWHRRRTERLFGFHYRIEIYLPRHRRRYGYYVLPFLLDDRLVARVDLKADRSARLLRVQAAYLEDGSHEDRVAGELADELTDLASWLGLDGVTVSPRGDLAAALRRRREG